MLVSISDSWSQQIAFPGAEGFGKYAKGDREGVVYYDCFLWRRLKSISKVI